MEIDHTAPQHVRDVIASLGRTEDLKFSPSNKLLAIAGYAKNKIAVFDVDVDRLTDDTRITLTNAFEIYSDQLNEPHGLDFLDEETIVVTNRSADVIFLKLRSDKIASNSLKLAPLEIIQSGDTGPLRGPSAVSVFRTDQSLYEAVICNNQSNNVTRHLVDSSAGCSVKSNEILLKKWLVIPDGVCVSADRRWLAISNADMRTVFLYEYNSSLNEFSEPDGILRCVFHPHGMQFTSDGRFILVADGGAPYVHIYKKNGSTWRGAHNPIKSLRVMNEENFLRGRSNPNEGGPKGIAVDNAMNVLAVTCEHRPLAFFDLKKILEDAQRSPDPGDNQGYSHEQGTLEVRYELEIRNQLDQQIKEIEKRAKEQLPLQRADEELALLKGSRSWRITAPLRRLSSALRNSGIM
jgi:WD40 repeat protein